MISLKYVSQYSWFGAQRIYVSHVFEMYNKIMYIKILQYSNKKNCQISYKLWTHIGKYLNRHLSRQRATGNVDDTAFTICQRQSRVANCEKWKTTSTSLYLYHSQLQHRMWLVITFGLNQIQPITFSYYLVAKNFNTQHAAFLAI